MRRDAKRVNWENRRAKEKRMKLFSIKENPSRFLDFQNFFVFILIDVFVVVISINVFIFRLISMSYSLNRKNLISSRLQFNLKILSFLASKHERRIYIFLLCCLLNYILKALYHHLVHPSTVSLIFVKSFRYEYNIPPSDFDIVYRLASRCRL